MTKRENGIKKTEKEIQKPHKLRTECSKRTVLVGETRSKRYGIGIITW